MFRQRDYQNLKSAARNLKNEYVPTNLKLIPQTKKGYLKCVEPILLCQWLSLPHF